MFDLAPQGEQMYHSPEPPQASVCTDIAGLFRSELPLVDTISTPAIAISTKKQTINKNFNTFIYASLETIGLDFQKEHQVFPLD